MVRRITDLYTDDPVVCAQLRSLRVTREVWDDNRGGGHFWFDISAQPANYHFYIDALADDSDGTKIEVILHSVGGLLKWAEWYRVDGDPISRWPPPTVRRHPNGFG